jgi:hypothetical protein
MKWTPDRPGERGPLETVPGRGLYLSRRQVLDRMGKWALGLGALSGLNGCGPEKPEAPVPSEGGRHLPTLRDYAMLLRDEVYRYRMWPLSWSVGGEQSYTQVRPCLEILGAGADHFASLQARDASWDEQTKAFQMHVSALMSELRRQDVFLGEEIQFDFANPQLAETSALAQLLYGHVNGFLSRRGFWVGGFGLRLSPRLASPAGGDSPIVSAALCLWQRPSGLYQAGAINPPELLYLHPQLKEATPYLVMLRKKSEPDLTENLGLAPTIAAFAEGQSVLILEDKLESDNQALENLVERKTEQLTALASLDFATAAQGRMGYVKDSNAKTLHVYARYWPVLSEDDACFFSIIQLATDVCSRSGRQAIVPQLVRYEMAAFFAWHEIEHLKYARGDDEQREILNRAYLNVDIFAHAEKETAAALSARARLQQEVEADLAGFSKAPCGALLIYLGRERHHQLGGSAASGKNTASDIVWRYIYGELQTHPEQYGLVVVPEDPALTDRIRKGAQPADLKGALQNMRDYGRASSKEQEELVIAPGAHALWPAAQILGQTYLVARSPERAQRLAEAVQKRMSLDERRDALAREIQTDQELAAPPSSGDSP